MNARAYLWSLLGVALVAGLAAVGLALSHPIGSAQAAPSAPSAVITKATPVRGADSLVRIAIVSAPFRANRRPAPVRYDPALPVQAAIAPTAAMPKPVLSLSGVVWGDVPAALLDGVPGAEGSRVMRVGEPSGGVTVRRIDRSRVLVTGYDTTWSLRLRGP